MDKEDARKLSPEQQKEKRKIALRMRTNGRKFTEIGEIVGVHPRTVQHWWSRYQAEGIKAAIEGGKRGTAEEPASILTIAFESLVTFTQVAIPSLETVTPVGLTLFSPSLVVSTSSRQKLQDYTVRIVESGIWHQEWCFCSKKSPEQCRGFSVAVNSKIRLKRGSFEFDNDLIHRKTFAGCGRDFLYLAVLFGLEDVFHLHGFNDGKLFAGLHFLAERDRNFPQQAWHG